MSPHQRRRASERALSRRGAATGLPARTRGAATGLRARTLGAAAGLVADRLLGEPPPAVHPVAGFGRLMAGLESRLWRDSRMAGAAYEALGVGMGLAAGLAAPNPALAAWLVVAGRSLGEEARRVGRALAAGDLGRARALLPALVGRDTDALDEKEMARAVIESVAENTVDAVVAPACFAAAAGAPAAYAYRTVNTLDAMVGHRSERYARFGWAAARLDDTVNWIPARLTAVLVAAVRPSAAREVLAVLRHPPEHPSPNAGVAEAAFAAALGLRLGGDCSYGGRLDPRPTFGSGRPPELADIEPAVRLSAHVATALAAAFAAAGLIRRRRP
jgi:adenosylcobinamide-phosphate synthase